jgi:Chlamydia polymorphic membrane protein (Chlamydia_PMP) repeat
MRLARPAAILVPACALALAACGQSQGVGTSARAPATSAATLAGAAPSQSASSHPTRAPAISSRAPHSAPGRSSLPSVRTAPRYRTSTSAAIHADHVVGHGTPGSCTSQAVVRAVAAGGVIAFSCGPRPVTIVMTATAKVRNTSAKVVLDGGGLITLSGGGVRRILYMDTCDPAQTWTTSHCQDQATPALTVENITFADGNSTGQVYDGGGGGAIFDRGGQLKVIDARFTGNRCDSTGPDLGGAAIRVLSQYQDRAVEVTGSTFTGGVCSNGGALSSIGVSWLVQDSTFTGNRAIGDGANPAQAGTPGGGSGGAIYTDGDDYSVTVDDCVITGNSAREGGGALFFVSNDKTGTLTIEHSKLRGNPNAGFQTAGYPGIFFLGQGHPVILSSSLS